MLFSVERAMRNRSSVLALAFLAVLASIPTRAQVSTSSITGVVTDSSGAFVPGAAVQARNEETGVVHEGVTTATGNYSFASLPPGPYTVTVSKPGFQTFAGV